MAYTTITKSSDYFNTKLYTGNGSSQSFTGVGFQPDFVWIKRRGNAEDHAAYDAVRGVQKRITPSQDWTEGTSSTHLTSFNSDGFTLGGSDANNGNDTYASWNWKANGVGSANTDGSISSTVSANTTSGFSIVKYTGNGGNSTVGHGLGGIVKVIFNKRLDGAASWTCGISAMPNGWQNYLRLDTNTVFSVNNNIWQATAPTNSVFYIGHDDVNTSGAEYISYCFKEIPGYSKFSSYTGNASNDGPFIYTGFKPAFLIIKRSDTGQPWLLLDNKRGTYNVNQSKLFPNASDAENTDTSNGVDFLSNGFKLRRNNGESNESGTYIYMAFAESPLVGSNNVPATAR